MLQTIKKLFGLGPKTDFAELVRNGATILDVRTKSEYAGGHIKGSLNIPLDQLSGQSGKLKDKNQAVITCCASGMRSAAARGILKSQGFSQVYNGGSWVSLRQYSK